MPIDYRGILLAKMRRLGLAGEGIPLLAVLHRNLGMGLSNGMSSSMSSAGYALARLLPLILALLSSDRDRPLPLDLAVLGEIGLSGEVPPYPMDRTDNNVAILRIVRRDGPGRRVSLFRGDVHGQIVACDTREDSDRFDADKARTAK
ncbi:hypothetical protein [Thiorhodococcus mannitoliphagus]|uniref:hypothetical protein n=1 Tax=Thiorhodococcus mannitoliphagus TaxID=329406 RepID=UPI00197EDD85